MNLKLPYYIFLFVGVLISKRIAAQADTVIKKNNITKEITIVEEEKTYPKQHSPKKASTYSAIFPGLGQIYNKKYWKLPIVYGAVGGTVYSFLWNQSEFIKARDAYRIRINGTPDQQGGIDPFYIPFSNDQIKANRDFYRRNRDLSVVLFLAVYLINILDASVDAHLYHFNVNDDLDAFVKPNIQMTGLTPAPALNLTFRFK
jgi:hypothetical protein